MLGPGLRRIINHYEQGPHGGPALMPYQDGVKRWTIGLGHLILPGEDYSKGITLAQVEGLLQSDAAHIGEGLMGLLNRQPTQDQWDALLSLAYNMGWHALLGSHIIAYFNGGDDASTEEAFGTWNHAGGQVENGLTCRRHTERTLYSTGVVVFYSV